MLELPRGDVDADGELRPFRRRASPARDLATRLLEHPAAELDDEAALLRDGDEVGRLHDSSCRVAPAEEGLDPDDALRREIEDRLVVQEKVFAGARLAQLAEKLEPPEHDVVHPRCVEGVLGLPGRLRPVHGDVRTPEQLVDVAAERDADARRDEHLDARDRKRRSERVDQRAR